MLFCAPCYDWPGYSDEAWYKGRRRWRWFCQLYFWFSSGRLSSRQPVPTNSPAPILGSPLYSVSRQNAKIIITNLCYNPVVTTLEYTHLCRVLPNGWISSAARVIAVIQLTVSLVKLSGGYIQEVKDARIEILSLQRSIEGVKGTLQDLQKSIQSDEGKTPPELEYSCRYWIYHLEQSQVLSRSAIEQVRLFLQRHFLYRVEAMSLLRLISEVVGILDLLYTFMEISNRVDSYCDYNSYWYFLGRLRFYNRWLSMWYKALCSEKSPDNR